MLNLCKIWTYVVDWFCNFQFYNYNKLISKPIKYGKTQRIYLEKFQCSCTLKWHSIGHPVPTHIFICCHLDTGVEQWLLILSRLSSMVPHYWSICFLLPSPFVLTIWSIDFTQWTQHNKHKHTTHYKEDHWNKGNICYTIGTLCEDHIFRNSFWLTISSNPENLW